ncbi:MAG TPA: DUF72 domain-containing protein [Polyangiaceae bacterium]|nr:DUF72 domain-containing protein [Polyangiaceae bacterium]
MAGRIYVGTSGWVYKSWAATFYPKRVPAKRHFAFYAEHFPTVEINASFYRLPEASTFRGWREQAPECFVYAVKGSRTVTHFYKLAPGAKSFDLLLERAAGLGPKLGPVLWQLPGGFGKDARRLADFVATLPRHLRHAIEFRDPSWLDAETSAILRRAGVASVALSSLAMPPNTELSADFAYLRFHGLEGGAAHDYTDRELEPWAELLRGCARRGVDAYVYFNNDVNVRAPFNALRLMDMVGAAAVRPAGPASGQRPAGGDVERPARAPRAGGDVERPARAPRAGGDVKGLARPPRAAAGGR